MLCLAVFSFCMVYAQTNGSSDNVYEKLLEKIEKKQNNQTLKEFREIFTFENFLALLDDYGNEAVAKKCGLDLIYKDKVDKRNTMVVYGYDVKKGKKKKYGYEIIPESEHACYVDYCPDCSSDLILYADLFFKSRYDANNFYKQAKEYGLIVYDEVTYVPGEKISSGYHQVDNSREAYEYNPSCIIGTVRIENEWYVIGWGFDLEGLVVNGIE